MGARAGRRTKRVVVLLLATLAALLGAELWVRAVMGAPLAERLPLLNVRANPVRGWEMVPGEHYTYQHRVAVNSLGLRGPELGPKVPGEQRVLFLGDSLTYGQGVADDETVPFALERALRERDPARAWSVLNGGLRAYGTAQEIALLEELGPRLEPDVVLLGWYWNDVVERPITPTYEAFLPRGEFAFDTGERLEGFARLRWYARQVPRRSALVMLLHDLYDAGRMDAVYAPAMAEEGFERLGGLLARLVALGAELGATPVVVIFPDPLRLTGRTDTLSYDERAVALARARELPVVELFPALEPLYAERGRPPVLPFDGHYDAAANRALGEHLAGELLLLLQKQRQ
jgi:lysophospholipase L1-like esterase